ncbi:hypothetical protein [Vulcanococcus sp.]|jgi:hypothetical protein
MRGPRERSGSLFSYVSIEERMAPVLALELQGGELAAEFGCEVPQLLVR